MRELPWFRGQDVGLERFVYHYVDFETMEAKTTARKYKYLEQFYADARTILHNIFVCFGGRIIFVVSIEIFKLRNVLYVCHYYCILCHLKIMMHVTKDWQLITEEDCVAW